MNVKIQTIFNIRDARDLCAEEKAILYAVATRGEAWGSWEKVAGDSGLSKDRFYKYRTSLEERGVLQVQKRPGTTTLCKVNERSLALMLPATALPGNPEALADNGTASGNEPVQEASGKPGDPPSGKPRNPLPGNPEEKVTTKRTSEGDHETNGPGGVNVWDFAALPQTVSYSPIASIEDPVGAEPVVSRQSEVDGVPTEDDSPVVPGRSFAVQDPADTPAFYRSRAGSVGSR